MMCSFGHNLPVKMLSPQNSAPMCRNSRANSSPALLWARVRNSLTTGTWCESHKFTMFFLIFFASRRTKCCAARRRSTTRSEGDSLSTVASSSPVSPSSISANYLSLSLIFNNLGVCKRPCPHESHNSGVLLPVCDTRTAWTAGAASRPGRRPLDASAPTAGPWSRK